MQRFRVTADRSVEEPARSAAPEEGLLDLDVRESGYEPYPVVVELELDGSEPRQKTLDRLLDALAPEVHWARIEYWTNGSPNGSADLGTVPEVVG